MTISLNSLNNGTSGWGAPPSNTNAANTGWGTPPGAGAPNSANSAISGGNPGAGVLGQGTVPGGVGAPSGLPPASVPSSSPPGGLNPGQSLPSANNNHQGGSNQWASTSPNRNTSQTTNGQPNISGSQMNNNPNGNATGQGPPSGNSMQLNNQNLVNNVMSSGNPNSQGVAASSPNPNQTPPGMGPSNSGGIIPNAGTSSWAQAAGKSLQASGAGVSGNPNMHSNPNQGNVAPGMSNAIVGGTNGGNPAPNAPSSSVTSKQIEQLNNMREALFSHDGWGGQNVNQDSSWDIPGSPEPTHKDLGGGQMTAPAGTSVWKANVNNGTDLWEAVLRNGGAPPPAPVAQKVPWGHTPTTNIGGTWGVDDEDTGDQSNVWTAPQSNTGNSGPSQAPANSNSSGSSGWSMNNGPQQPPQREPNNGMWNQAPMKKENPDWGNGGGGGGGGNRPDVGRGHGSHGGPDNRGVGVMVGGHDNNPGGRGWDDGRNNGRINNGSVDPNPGMWNKPQPPPVQQPPPQQSHWNGGPPSGAVPSHGGMGMGGGANMGGMKENMGGGGGGGKGPGSGWDDVSPPTQRRPVPNIPNYDDGTALWGNPIAGGQQPQQQQQQQHPQQRGMPPNRPMPNKMDAGGNPVGWGGGNRNGGWTGPDGPQDGGFNSGGGGGGGGWDDDKSGGGGGGSWGEPPIQQQGGNSWGKPKTPTNPSAWGNEGIVDTSSWGAPPKNSGSSRYHNGSPNANSNTTKDIYWSNKSCRLLAEMGYKKEEIEMALRQTSSMNLSDAIDSLTLDNVGGRGGPPMDQSLWGAGGGGPMQGQQRRGPPPQQVEDHFDLGLGGHGGPMGMGPPQQQRYGVPNPKGFSGANSLMNNVANPSLNSINPTLLQRILTQQPNNSPQPGRVQPNNAPTQQFPFNKSVSVLVQQIQMAVQAGYLSNQILQHPLPPQSLVLLNTLLQQIKNFQMLTQTQHQMGNSNSSTALQLSVQITKTKQHIQNLHNQIAAQQAHHAKQQQQQHQPHHMGGGGGGGGGNAPNNDFYKPPPIIGDGRGGGSNLMDPLMSMQNNFGADFLLKEGQSQGQGQHQQSRLSQWTKMEDKDISSGDFSRAPGPQSNNGGMKNNSSLILGQSDNTWSTSVGSRSGTDGWPTDHSNPSGQSGGSNPNMSMNDDSGKSNPALNMNSDAWQTDLVPEFEPGKPWKGTQILKSVDDDPTLTPGSVVRSPLSLATIKDATEIFAKNASSTAVSSLASDSLPLSLSSSSTWSYTPTSAGASNSNQMAKLNSTRDLWDYGAGGNGGQGQGSRPPPGLPKKGAGPTTPVANTGGNLTSGSNSFRNNSWGGPNQSGAGGPGNSYFWLLLRNLTPQIDGSTLKTLCVQHGPLQKFHLYLNHGVALVRYSTREEAAKAQNALNNCVLGNTTILAETAGENDVQGLLHGLNIAVNNAQQSNSGMPERGFSGSNSNENPWGVLRDNSPLWSNNPWGSSGMDAPDRATPSSLNSLLPGDLLGGESA